MRLTHTVNNKNKEIIERYGGDEKNVPYFLDARTEVIDKDLEVEFSIQDNAKYQSNNYNFALSGYPLGEYRISSVINGEEYMRDFIDILQGFMVENEDETLDITVTIFGQADGYPVSSTAQYSGDAGTIASEQFYSLDRATWGTKTLVPGVTLLCNEDFAFLRAFWIKEMFKHSKYFQDAHFNICVSTVPSIGPKHRRIVVGVKIKNAFQKAYDNFNGLEKALYDVGTVKRNPEQTQYNL